MYLKMFVGEKKEDPLRGIQVATPTDDDDINERIEDGMTTFNKPNNATQSDFNYSVTMKSTKFYDKSLVQKKNSQETEIDYDLTKTNYGKSLSKKVQFQQSPKNVLTKKDVTPYAEQQTDDKMVELFQALKDLQDKNNQVSQGLTDSLTCENPKILEILMEHIILNWEDIVHLLLDELIHEEVQELNNIEFTIQGTEQPQHKTNLADRSLYGKYHDYKSVDLKDIMSLFDDYLNTE